MSLGNILNLAGSKMGLSKNSPSQRLTLLRFANEAAIELYDQSDPPGCLLEQAFKVNGDQTISCPGYVGKIRAARELDSQVTWSINKLRPRYNQFNWPDSWRNLRLKNTQALMTTVTNTSVGVLTVSAVENPPIVVTVCGPTANSTMATEAVTMSATSVNTVNAYIDYTSITKSSINLYDITLSDVDGKLLSIIPNNMYEAKYQILDVSSCPWLAVSTSSLDHYLEILFKKTLPYLSNDSDEYPAQGYDHIIVNKILQLWYEEQGKTDIATAYDSKATRSLARKKQDQELATEDMIGFCANPHDVILPRIRAGRRKYYRGYGSRGWGY